MDKYYSLTKTLILSGIQCEKKLWFDLSKNDKIESKDKAATVALSEISVGKVGIEMLNKVPG